VALLPYSLYAFGQGLGPVIAAPISETYGRRATYMPYMILFTLFTLGAGFSNSITALCICRYFAGLTGAPALGVGLGTIADIWSPQDRAVPTAIMVVTPFLGPSLG
jgi:MFS family permease